MHKVKSTFVLFFFSGVSQFLLVGSVLYFTKFLNPKEFGFFAIYVTAGSIIGSMLSLKFELGISAAENNETAIRMVRLTLTSSFFLTLLIVILSEITLLLLAHVETPNLNFIRTTRICFYAYFFSISLNAAFQQYCYHLERFKQAGILTLLLSITNISLTYLFISTATGHPLVWGHAASYLACNALAFFILFPKAFSFFSPKQYFKQLQEHSYYPKNLLGNAMLALVLSYQLQLYGLTTGDTEDLGLLQVAFKLTIGPLMLLAVPISSVMRVDLSKISSNSRRFGERFLKYSVFLIVLFVLASLALIAFSESLVTFLLDESYSPVTEFIKIILPYGLSLIIVNVLLKNAIIYRFNPLTINRVMFCTVSLGLIIMVGLESMGVGFKNAVLFGGIFMFISLLALLGVVLRSVWNSRCIK